MRLASLHWPDRPHPRLVSIDRRRGPEDFAEISNQQEMSAQSCTGTLNFNS